MSGMVYIFCEYEDLISFVYFSELVGNFDETSKGEWEECARIDKNLKCMYFCRFVILKLLSSVKPCVYFPAIIFWRPGRNIKKW